MADLEGVLANAGQAFSAAGASTNPVYVLTDGRVETLAALLLAQKRPDTLGTQVVAIENPYPLASFFLGTYYNEIGSTEDALRALDAGGRAADGIPVWGGQTRPIMLSERGIALAALKRWQELFRV